MQTIALDNREISNEAPAFIIAEAACNHFCELDLARQLIDEAAEAGADAIKFQTYRAEKLTSKSATAYGNIQGESQYEYYRKFDRFGRAEYDDLFEHAREKGIIAFSTPFDPESAQMLNSVHVPLFKIASCDLLYADLLREVACFGKPILLSTGASTLEEIETALSILDQAGAREVVLLACTLSYPTPADDANYRKIQGLRSHFADRLVGVSDHLEPEPYMISGAICVSLGACVLEKHFALDRTSGGGTAFSMTPSDLALYVENIRLAERLLGSAQQRVYPVEETTRTNARRSLVANFDLPAGTLLDRTMIGVKRPGTGVPPHRIDEVVGKTLAIDLPAEKQFDWGQLKP